MKKQKTQKELDKDFDNDLEILIRRYLYKYLQPILIVEILDMHKKSMRKSIKNMKRKRK